MKTDRPRRAATAQPDLPAGADARDVAAPGLPSGRSREALTLALRGLDLAAAGKRPHDMGRALTQVGRALRAMGALAPAEDYLVQALRWATMLPGADARVDLTCELAELCCTQAEIERDSAEHRRFAGMATRDRALGYTHEAVALAGQTSDALWEAKVLLRLSDVLNRCGSHDRASALQHRAMALMGQASAAALATAADEAGLAPEAAPEPRLLAPSSTRLM